MDLGSVAAWWREGGWACGFIEVGRWAAIGGTCETRIDDVEQFDGRGWAPQFLRTDGIVQVDADR